MQKHQSLSTFAFKRYEQLKKKEEEALKKAQPYLRLARRYRTKKEQIDTKLTIAQRNSEERAKAELENPAKGGRSAKARAEEIKKEIAELEANERFQKLSPREQQRYKLIVVKESRRV
ncbi:MAG: hypothetical protein NTY48_03325 [Candidatus Diapherotrites archaeon]|nr:hypothetical protein [Candidatus Diapherotrites archaeon]